MSIPEWLEQSASFFYSIELDGIRLVSIWPLVGSIIVLPVAIPSFLLGLLTGWKRIFAILALILPLSCSILLLISGGLLIHEGVSAVITGWEPIATPDGNIGRGRGSIFLFALYFWPFAEILYGLFFGILTGGWGMSLALPVFGFKAPPRKSRKKRALQWSEPMKTRVWGHFFIVATGVCIYFVVPLFRVVPLLVWVAALLVLPTLYSTLEEKLVRGRVSDKSD